MGIMIALRAFKAALFNQEVAIRIKDVLLDSRNVVGGIEKTFASATPVNTETFSNASSLGARLKIDSRSEALELLAALQRDARFIDFIKEDVTGCDDAALAAAARATHDRCAETIERFFKIRPLSEVAEGETATVNLSATNPARERVVGLSPSGEDVEVTCRVAHAGWVAEKCETPRWSGKAEDAFILAPIELEVERS